MEAITRLQNPLEEIVRVTNTGTEPFRGQYEGKVTVIGPGETADMVNRDAAVLWFGNPGAIDYVENGEPKNNRTNECLRLDARYGVFPVRRDEASSTPARTREEAWPQVQVRSISGKETYRMVVNDPEGLDLQPANQTKGEVSDLREMIDQMQKRIETYEAEIARGAQPEPVGTDAPTRRTKAS